MDHKAYRKLEAWRLSMDLAAQTYVLSKQLPKSEQYGLCSQMQRAVVSIPANIAEGYGRSHRGDYLRHLSIARGSLMELETHLTLAVRLKLLKRDDVISTWKLAQNVGRTLTALIKSLRPPDSPPQTLDPRP